MTYIVLFLLHTYILNREKQDFNIILTSLHFNYIFWRDSFFVSFAVYNFRRPPKSAIRAGQQDEKQKRQHFNRSKSGLVSYEDLLVAQYLDELRRRKSEARQEKEYVFTSDGEPLTTIIILCRTSIYEMRSFKYIFVFFFK